MSFCKNKFNLFSSQLEDGLGCLVVCLKTNIYKKLSVLIPLSHKDGRQKSAKPSGLVVLLWYIHFADICKYIIRKRVTFGGKEVIVFTFFQTKKIFYKTP